MGSHLVEDAGKNKILKKGLSFSIGGSTLQKLLKQKSDNTIALARFVQRIFPNYLIFNFGGRRYSAKPLATPEITVPKKSCSCYLFKG